MKRLIACGLVFFFSISFAAAQNFQKNLSTYTTNFTEERIHLHYDKSFYAPGDTIWFKLYMMETTLPADKSKTVYIDWTDENGSLLLHTMSLAINGTSYGQFEIPENYDGQWIHVRAYTRWMLNFDTSFLYNKNVRILAAPKDSLIKIAIEPELHFFPEGGDIVAGVNNKIAFKATDQFGRPIQIKGNIQNERGEVLQQLKIVHDGMGYFYVIPREREKLTAYWQDEKGVHYKTELPEVKNSGISLQLSIAGSRRNFLVNVSPGSIATLKTVHLVGTEYQQPVFNITKPIKNGFAGGVLATNKLPTGILTITVFDDDWKPLGERITFIKNKKFDFHPSVVVKKAGLTKRAKNELEIEVPDSLDADLSIAVTDCAIGADTSSNIISDLFLTSELRGKVSDPAYYFQNNSDSIMQQLDLVMLTNGWRRINWQKLLAGEFPEIKYPRDTAYFSIAGKISGATPRQLKSAGGITLIVNPRDSGMQFFTLPVKPDGSFSDRSLVLFDTAKIYYQLSSNKLSNVKVEFAKEKPLPFLNNSKASGTYFNNAANTIGDQYQINLIDSVEKQLEHFRGKVLATVKIKARPKSVIDKMDEKYTSGAFSGFDAAHQYDVEDDPFAKASNDVYNYLQGKVGGLKVIYGPIPPPRFEWEGDRVDLFLNESPVTPDALSSIALSDIAYIKLFRAPFVLSHARGGVIAIYTRKGITANGLPANTVIGYSISRQFYSPDYDSSDEHIEKKDLRTTLYWNPSVITTPGKNKVLLKFFNNDVTKSFRVIIEGMTKDGRLAHVEQVME